MNHDHIIKEVQAIREQLAASHGYNVRACLRQQKKRQQESGRKVVKLTPRRLKVADEKSGITNTTIRDFSLQIRWI